MLEKSFGLLFFMRKPKNYKTGPLPVYLKITIDGAATELSAKRKCEPTQWSSKSGRAIGNKESVKELNHYLDSLELMVFQAKRKLIEKDMEIRVEAIKNLLTGTDEKKVMILEVFKYHNIQMKALEGTEFAANTVDRYETTINHAKAFIRWKYGSDDMEIKKLNHEFITEFCFWFKSEQKCNHNSTMKYLSNFKKIVLISANQVFICIFLEPPNSRTHFTKVLNCAFLLISISSQIITCPYCIHTHNLLCRFLIYLPLSLHLTLVRFFLENIFQNDKRITCAFFR